MPTPSASSREDFFSSKRDAALLTELDATHVPAHIAVIMDGNGRWAARRGLPRAAGHRAGVKAVRETIAAAQELGVQVLTLYSFSSENWRRPAAEVSGLMNLFVETLGRELRSLESRDIAVRVVGHMDRLPAATRQAFSDAQARTSGNESMLLQIALDYGGRTEITDAARAIARDVARGALDPADVDEAAVSSRLYTAGVPDPDLVIRTSGELRVSNFLLWQIAYSELWATATLWPDFRRHDLLRAVIDYQRRERRFGGSQ
jgi:undecaprenyl diphosphate synthase